MSENRKPEENITAENSPQIKKKGVFRQLWEMLLHNWLLKLICLVLAVLLWGFIYSQDDTLTREKVFTNVQVSFGESYVTSLRSRGYVITEGMDTPQYVTVKLAVPQRYYDSVTEKSFTVRPDLTQISHAGENSVPLVYSGNNSYGKATLSQESLTLTVEKYTTRSYGIAVNVVKDGELPEGWWADGKSLVTDPERVALSGPDSLVRSVVSCDVLMDMSTLTPREGAQSVLLPFTLMAADGTAVDPSLVTVTVPGQATVIDSVNVKQNIWQLSQMKVNTDGLIKGTPAEGYRIGKVTVSPESVYAAFENPILPETLIYPDGVVDVSGFSETVRRRVLLTRPADCLYISSYAVEITVEILPDAEAAP